MSRAIRKSRRAESDLLEIWRYSFDEWDEKRADKYLDELDEAFCSLTGNPELSSIRDFVRKGYRVLFVNRHAVYYTATSSEIYVVRVLHGQMDPARHF